MAGIANFLPEAALLLWELSGAARVRQGESIQRAYLAAGLARELTDKLESLSLLDIDPRLVHWYKAAMTLCGFEGYRHHRESKDPLNALKPLRDREMRWLEAELASFNTWFEWWKVNRAEGFRKELVAAS